MSIHDLQPDVQQKLIDALMEHLTPSRRQQINAVAALRTRHLTLALEDVYQSHNAAAVVRSCDCFGIQDVHVIENRNALKLDNTTVSKGADKWLDFHHYNQPRQDNTSACIHALKKCGYRIAATTLRKKSIALEALPLDEPVAILIGTELKGLTDIACDLADSFIQLPMYGFTQSFNLSVTAALCLNALTHRLRQSKVDWRMSAQELRDLKLSWLHKCLKQSEVIIASFLKEIE